MQNLAIFHESNKDAAYYRQQVSERGVLEKIDALNDGLLRIKGVDEENLSRIYEVLNDIEISLNKNANDPRTRMALNSFKPESEKEPEKKLVVDTEEDLKNPDTENLKGTDPDGGVIGEQGEQGKVPTGEPTGEPDPEKKVDTTETQELTGESTGEPSGEPDLTEKVDTTETQEPTGEPIGETPGPTPETPVETPVDIDGVPAPKKGGRKKKTETAE